MNWWVIIATFIAVNLDFFFILLCLLQKYRLSAVIFGYLLGVLLLVNASYLAGQILLKFLPEWLLGILGFLPIWMALHDNDEERQSDGQHRPIINVLITYLSVCAGCNLSIFLPVLTGISINRFLAVLLVISLCTIFIVVLLKFFGEIPPVKHFMTKYSEILMKIVYIGVGLYVFWDSGLISHLSRIL